MSKYKRNNQILFVKDKDGYMCGSKWDTFQTGTKPLKFHQSNPYTIQNIKHYMDLNTEGYELLSTEYICNSDKLLFKCPKGHEFKMCWGSFQQGKRCSICSSNCITSYNCIATTDPWMIDLGMSREDAETHTHGSNDKVIVICPHCGKTRKALIKHIYTTKSIACTCGDGVSYPEKFIISLLDQLNVKYIHEYKPKWSCNKRYDFYLYTYDIIIECHGEQHYKQTTRKGEEW